MLAFKVVAYFLIWLIWFSAPAYAQQESYTFADQLANTTFNSLPVFETGGAVSSLDEETTATIGYEVGKVWEAGDAPSDVVKVGDIEDSLGAEQMSLRDIADAAGFELGDVNVSQLRFLDELTVDELLSDIGFLGDWTVEELVEKIEEEKGESQTPYAIETVFDGSGTINEQIKANPELGEMAAQDVFGDLKVTDIPNMEYTQLGKYEGISNQTISNVEGLGDVAMAYFPNTKFSLFPMATQDVVFGPKEYSGIKPTPDPVSGGNNGTEIWEYIACSGGCPHIELYQQGWEGAQWMTKEHRVRDGFGVLGNMVSEAGAYRIPFGDSFALQVVSTDEAAGAAEWGLAFRVCYRGFPDLGCTAYFMEVPLGITTHEGDTVLTGFRDLRGGSLSPMDAPPGWEDLRPDTPDDIAAVIGQNTASSGFFRTLCGDGPGGVKMEALSEAFHKIESRGSGDYGAVGVYVSLSAGETGRALGRYQYMSYREDAVAKISTTDGGRWLLQKARTQGAQISREEVLNGFPPEMQEAVFEEDQIRNMEAAMAAGYEGEAMLSVVAQMHFRGRGILTNGQLNSESVGDKLGTSTAEYGRRFVEYYREAEAKLPEGDAEERCKSTGTYINPTKAGHKSFSRRFSATGIYNPVSGTVRKHDGDDVLVPQGSEIVASDGGIVEWRDNPGGYGWYMYVWHDTGDATVYAHLSKRIAPSGARVKQGQVIALSGGAQGVQGSGGSTGPHLHFEFRVEGTNPIPPQAFVDYNKTVGDI